MLTLTNYNANQIPTITSPPQSRTNYAGTSANFSVVAGGNGPFAYRWRKNGTNLADGARISGAASWSLMLSNISLSDAGNYDVVVTGFTSITSAPPAVLGGMGLQTNQLLLYEPFS